MQIDFLKQREVNRPDFLVERGHPGTGCRINCARVAMPLWWIRRWRLAGNTGSFHTELLVSLRDDQSEKQHTIGTPQCLHYPSSYPKAFQLNSSFHVGKMNALSFPRWNFYWRSHRQRKSSNEISSFAVRVWINSFRKARPDDKENDESQFTIKLSLQNPIKEYNETSWNDEELL